MNPFAYEWLRIKTIRSTWVMITISTVLTLAIAIIATLANKGTAGNLDRNWSDIVRVSMTAMTWLFGALLGIFAFGHEYRYGTIRPTLSALPKRRVAALAKFVVPAALFSTVTAISGALGIICARILAGSALTISWSANHLIRTFALTLLQVALWAILGAAIAAITRSQIASIIGLLVWVLLIENLLVLLFTWDALESVKGVRKYLPGAAANSMVGTPDPDVLGWVGGSITFALIAIGFAIVGTELFARRDA